MGTRAEDVVDALVAHQDDGELAKVRKRLDPTDQAIGLRMRDLFDVAKAHEGIALGEVDRLLDHPAYEPRLAAFCILDFQARRRLTDAEREDRCALYLRRHDRITAWDMVDRAAPRVVGGRLAGRSLAPLERLARSNRPLERRTAITAPLHFVKYGTDADVEASFGIAALLAADPEPVASNAVGIFLKHAGRRLPSVHAAFLATHGAAMPAAARRLATA